MFSGLRLDPVDLSHAWYSLGQLDPRQCACIHYVTLFPVPLSVESEFVNLFTLVVMDRLIVKPWTS